MKLIREHDDFNWIDEVSVNPWVNYDVIDFDVVPTKEHVIELINMCLTHNNDRIQNLNEWGDAVIEDDAELIIDYAMNGYSYLGFNTGNYFEDCLSYDKYYDGFDLSKSIKYSDLIKSNVLKESEDDGLDWIRNIKPMFELTNNTIYYTKSGDITKIERILKLISERMPEARWTSGLQVKTFTPKQANMIRIDQFNKLTYSVLHNPDNPTYRYMRTVYLDEYHF